jgi:nitroreductase
METLAAIEKRWGCRKYTDQAVDRELLGTVLDAGRLAPSAGNLQDRSFIVVKNSETKTEIAKASGNQTWMQTAPVHVVVLAEHKKNAKFFGVKGEKVYAVQDAAFAVENMLLAATDLGLGCSLVIGFNEQRIKDILAIQEPAEPYAIITLGYAGETPKLSSKYPLEKFVFFEKHNAKVETEAAFGDFTKIKEQANAKANEAMEGAQKTGFNLFAKIRSFFSKKKTEEQAQDHFMEERPMMSELKPEMKEEIPRILPKR